MRIVIIDDDKDIHNFLTLYLQAEGFKVFSAYEGTNGLELIRGHNPDLVVLDIALPGVTGWDVCKQIRTFSSIPIFMISAVALEHTDQIHSLLIGADDYMTKPLPLPVFKARIQALLRRSTNWQDGRQVYVDAHLKIDLYRKEVFIQGRQVFLSDLEYRLLELLVVNRNQTVPMAEIIEQLWFSEVSKNHAYHVRSYIMRLRRLIEPDMNASRYLINEHGLGYRFDSQPFHTVSQSYINHI